MALHFFVFSKRTEILDSIQGQGSHSWPGIGASRSEPAARCLPPPGDHLSVCPVCTIYLHVYEALERTNQGTKEVKAYIYIFFTEKTKVKVELYVGLQILKKF